MRRCTEEHFVVDSIFSHKMNIFHAILNDDKDSHCVASKKKCLENCKQKQLIQHNLQQSFFQQTFILLRSLFSSICQFGVAMFLCFAELKTLVQVSIEHKHRVQIFPLQTKHAQTVLLKSFRLRDSQKS